MHRTLLCTLLLVACGPGKADDGESAGSSETSSTDETDPTDDPSTPTTPTTGDVVEENPAGLCNPNADTVCPTDHICCSDDPATIGGRIPNYFMPGVFDEKYASPIFSGNNNPLSHWGQCVEVGGFASPFPSGCPVPCNPTWEPGILAEICGTSVCCSFTMIDPAKDCVIDPQSGLWRAVTGHDIPALTNWGGQHTTNQDPLGVSCTLFASGGGSLSQAAFEDCVAQLTVADQRGFCYDPAQCPCHEDLCAMKNPGYVPRCP